MPAQRLTLSEALNEASTYYYMYELNSMMANMRATEWWGTLSHAQRTEYYERASSAASVLTDRRFDEYDFEPEDDEPNTDIPEEERVSW